MGYGPKTFELLAGLRRDGTLADVRSVIDLGAQEAFLSGEIGPAVDLLRAFGLDDPDPADTRALVDKRFVRHLWERAGVEYTSTDYDAQFDTVLIDLNYDAVPDGHRNRYDLVTNCGTTEHVVNQMNSFKAVHDLCRHGGLMFHDLPWSGMFNHGLFNYKPHLFWRLCQSNGYGWVGMWFRTDAGDPLRVPDNILDYCRPADREAYGKYLAHDGMMTVVLRKNLDVPFVCPLDMEETMVLPAGRARQRYWSLADPGALNNLDAYRACGFPNAAPEQVPVEVLEAERAAGEVLRGRCRDLEGRTGQLEQHATQLERRIAWMEGSRFWRLRNRLSRYKRGVMSRLGRAG